MADDKIVMNLSEEVIDRLPVYLLVIHQSGMNLTIRICCECKPKESGIVWIYSYIALPRGRALELSLILHVVVEIFKKLF